MDYKGWLMSTEIVKNIGLGIVEAKKQPMLSIVDTFLKELDKENTRKNYKRYLTRYCEYIEEKLGVKKLDDFGKIALVRVRENCTEFIKINRIKDDTTKEIVEKERADSTKRFVRSILSSFWNYIVEAYDYRKNPVAKLKLGKVPNKSNTKSLAPCDLKKKLKYLYDYRKFSQIDFVACALAYTLAGTSLRISEALQITKDMVERGEIEIKPKGGGTRKIELPKEVTTVLKEYCNTYKEKITDHVFVAVRKSRKTKKIEVMKRTNASRLLKKYTGISAHGFRKSVIEGLIESGVHNHEVAKVSGHASINMVYYYDNRDSKTDAHKEFFSSVAR